MSTFSAKVRSLIDRIQYKDWTFNLEQRGDALLLQVRFDAPDAGSGEIESWGGRKWYLSQHMTEGEIVQTAFLAVKVAEEHEMRESFRFDGAAIFGPHLSIAGLLSIADRTETRAPKGAEA